MVQMLGLHVNSIVEDSDYDDAHTQKIIASKMDIQDIIDVLTPHVVVPLASREEAMPGMETDPEEDKDPSSPRAQPSTHEPLHGLVRDPINPSVILLGTDDTD